MPRWLIRLCGEQKDVFFWLFIGIVLNAGLLYLGNIPPISDEGFNVPQISAFSHGNYTVEKELTMLPVYHGVIALLLKVVGGTTLQQARLISFLGAAFGVFFFYLLVQRVSSSGKYLRTIQFVTLPILFPFHFLLYTDAWSLAFVLLSIERALAEKPTASGVSAWCAVLFRQPAIFWAGFAWLLLLWRKDEDFLPPFSILRQRLRDGWVFVLLFLSFVVFILLNGGVAIGDRQHQQASLNLANVWFLLLLIFCLFAPEQFCSARKLVHLCNRRPIILGGIGGLFTIYSFTYAIHHVYNQPGLWFFLRNRILFWSTTILWLKLIAFCLIMVALCYLWYKPLPERRMYLLYPVAFLSVLFLPLIEQRYYLPAFAIFLAFRERSNPWQEWALIGIYGVASMLLSWGIARHAFFL